VFFLRPDQRSEAELNALLDAVIAEMRRRQAEHEERRRRDG
jgi:hypothetical protein